LICQFILHWWGDIYQCNQATTAQFNENSPSCEFQSNSTIQRVSGGTEDRGSKTNGSGGSWRVRSRKNPKQKKNIRNCEIYSTVEGIYSRAWDMRERGRLGECKGSSSWVWGINTEVGYSGRKKVGGELVKMEVSFSRGETLKGR